MNPEAETVNPEVGTVERLPELVTTDRLVLRRWTVDDAEQLQSAVTASADHLRPWFSWMAFEPLGIDERRDLIRTWHDAWAAGGDAVYGVFDGAVTLGGCGLHRRRGPGVLEIGYWIHVDHTRLGYATELTQSLTSAAFGMAGIERVEVHHDKANEPSGGVPRALGFTMTGERADRIEAPGEVGIDCSWVMSRSDWTSDRPSTIADGGSTPAR